MITTPSLLKEKADPHGGCENRLSGRCGFKIVRLKQAAFRGEKGILYHNVAQELGHVNIFRCFLKY
jgi:hypothetical protein